MKTKVEIEGYEIEISFENGVISVAAEKDDEIIEEFSINVEESEGGEEGEEEIQSFGDYEEEEDFSGASEEDDDDDEDDDESSEEESEDEEEKFKGGAALESFQSFINKKK